MKQRADFTFKHNQGLGRHGWLRLTPAYSVKLVGDILNDLGGTQVVLEPFSGTGTTAVVCAERASTCDSFDINPFLTWLGETKTRNYSPQTRLEVTRLARVIAGSVAHDQDKEHWTPPISNIERWWSAGTLRTLSAVYAGIGEFASGPEADILKVAFCRIMIDWSNAAFNHQSMSFKKTRDESFSFDTLSTSTRRARS